MFALPTAALEVLNALHGEQTYASPVITATERASWTTSAGTPVDPTS
jgi:hypothetical protein